MRRLRQNNGVVLRIDAEMTLHDIAMTRLRQFWKRSERAGYAFAEGAAMHGAFPNGTGFSLFGVSSFGASSSLWPFVSPGLTVRC